MSVDLTTIYNQALDAIGARNDVASASETSREAEECNLWFSTIRDQVLSSARWPEATKLGYLSLLNEIDDDGVWEVGEARPNYLYAYARPTDMLRPQFLTDFSRFIIMAYGTDNLALMTDTEDANLVYTFRQEQISLWSTELRMAIVYGLAANICMPLTGKPSRAKVLISQANNLIIAARESAANTDDEQFEVLPDWIAARGYAGGTLTKYFYPYGSFLSVGTP